VKPLGQHLLVDLFECDANAISSLQVLRTSMLEPKVAADYLAEMFGAGRVSQARLERGVLGSHVQEMPDRLPR